MQEKFINLDSAAAYPPNPFLAKWYGELLECHAINPHGGTCYAERSRRLILDAGRRILSLLRISESEAVVVWTSGITEALNLAAFGFMSRKADIGICVDAGAHPSLMLPCRERSGKFSSILPLDKNGKLRLEEMRACDLLALSLVNNETGAVQNLRECRRVLDSFGGHRALLVDAAQAFCKMRIPWSECGVDMLALSSRKIGGPAAVGALIVRRDCQALKAAMLGGGQQGGVRSGTMDACGIEMFARSAESAHANMELNLRHVSLLYSLLWNELCEAKLPLWRRISPADASPHIAMLSFPGYEGAVLARLLAQNEGILISSAAACTAEHGGTSATIAGMGFDQAAVKGAIRISLSPLNTEEEVVALVGALKRVLEGY